LGFSIFKRLENVKGRDNACCGAQMFLGSDEGVVFKGAVGPGTQRLTILFISGKKKPLN
jgi:hypothetical protein